MLGATASNIATAASVPIVENPAEENPAPGTYDLGVLGLCFAALDHIPYFTLYPCAEKVIHPYGSKVPELDNPDIFQGPDPYVSAAPSADT